MTRSTALAVLLAMFATGSARAADAKTKPHVASAMDGRVSINFPTRFQVQRQDVQSRHGKISFVSHKSQADGVFFNLLIITYPPSVVAAAKNPLGFIGRLGAGNEKQKSGAKTEYFRALKESAYPAVEHRFNYPAGENSKGLRYQPGFAQYRHFLMDANVISAFVDVVGEKYAQRKEAIDQQVVRFMESLKIADKQPVAK